jgi:small subunit ribosomal protein S20
LFLGIGVSFMANHSSARKKNRRDERARLVNRSRVSRLRTFIKKALASLSAADKSEAEKAVRLAQKELMRSVSKDVIHRNTAARKISQLFLKLKAL